MNSARPPETPAGTGPAPCRKSLGRGTACAAGVAALLLALSLPLRSGDAQQPPAAPGTPQPGEVYLRLERAGAVRVNMVLGELVPQSDDPVVRQAAISFREMVRADLLFTDLFQIRSQEGPPPAGDEAVAAALAAWKTEGQDAAAWGTVGGSAEALTVNVDLYEVPTGRLISRESLTFASERFRDSAHDLADRLVLLLTGEQGVFQTRIAFVSDRSGHKEIYAMDYDGQDVVPLTRNGSINLSPAWAPGGARLGFVSFVAGDADIYLLGLPRIEMEALARRPGLDSDPDFSPTGDRIAFTRAEDGNPDIYVARLEGTRLADVMRITRDRAVDCCPSWSPSGRELAFMSDRSGNPQLYIMEADGTDVRRITFVGDYNASPAWSPRGDRIAFVSRLEEGFCLLTVSPTARDLARLTAGPGSYESPSWSPDGRQLALSSTRDGPERIYIMNADGSNLHVVSTGPGRDSSPAWAPRPGPGASGPAAP